MKRMNPYVPPTEEPPAQSFGAPRSASGPYQGELYVKVPLHRRNGPVSVLLLFGLLFAFVGPFLLSGVSRALGVAGPAIVGTIAGSPFLAVCVVVLTGPVYFDAYVEPGKLRRWGFGNKVVAALMLLGWVYSIVRTFI